MDLVSCQYTMLQISFDFNGHRFYLRIIFPHGQCVHFHYDLTLWVAFVENQRKKNKEQRNIAISSMTPRRKIKIYASKDWNGKTTVASHSPYKHARKPKKWEHHTREENCFTGKVLHRRKLLQGDLNDTKTAPWSLRKWRCWESHGMAQYSC